MKKNHHDHGGKRAVPVRTGTSGQTAVVGKSGHLAVLRSAQQEGRSDGLGSESDRLQKQRMMHSRTGSRPESDPRIGVGLWIDHRKAVIVFVTATGATTTLILSHIDRRPGRSEGLRSTARFEPHLVPADGSRERRHTGQLNLYYDAVIACIRGAQSILAFGPGEAKDELRRRLALNKLDPRNFRFEIADKMTDRQIAARTRHWLAEPRTATLSSQRRSGRPNR